MNDVVITNLETTIHNKIKVQPCTTKGILKVSSIYEMYKIEVTNKAAQLLLKKTCTNKTEELDLQAFSEDIYFVTIFCLNGINFTKKVIIN